MEKTTMKFVKEFSEFTVAKLFAEKIGEKVFARYDWDEFKGEIVKSYVVEYEVI